MNTKNRPDPSPCQPNTQPDNCNSAADNGQVSCVVLSEFISQCITSVIGWAKAISAQLNKQQCHDEKAEAIFVGFGEQLARVQDILARGVDSIRSEQARLCSRINQLADRLDTQSFNLEQIRTLAESSIRKTEQLADEFISRHVTDGLFKEFARLYAALSHVEKTRECAALAEDIERFLDDHGLSLIQPKVGDLFDPRQHHAIEQRGAEDRKLRGRIARTFRPGLIKGQRIIQPAQVEVFTEPNQKEV